MQQLYIADFGNGLVKVGVSANVKKRLSNISNAGGLPSYEKMRTFSVSDARLLEQSIITKMSSKKTVGEWFLCSFDEMLEVVEEVIKYTNPTETETSGDCVEKLLQSLTNCVLPNNMVSLNSVFSVGNKIRELDGKPAHQMAAFLNAKSTVEYLEAVKHEWNLTDEQVILKRTKGTGCTLAHISVALLAASQISTELHVKIHKLVLSETYSKFEKTGGTEFPALNAAISNQFGDNKGVFISVAKALRDRILGSEAKTEDWNTASVDQTHMRYEMESKLCTVLRLGVVKDFEHLKDLISKL